MHTESPILDTVECLLRGATRRVLESDLERRFAMRSCSNSSLRVQKGAEAAPKACSPDHPPGSKARKTRCGRSRDLERSNARRIFEFSRQVATVHRVELARIEPGLIVGEVVGSPIAGLDVRRPGPAIAAPVKHLVPADAICEASAPMTRIPGQID